MTNTTSPQAPATLAPIVGVSHRALIVDQNRYEDVRAGHALAAEDAREWQTRRGETVQLQTVTSNYHPRPSRFETAQPDGMTTAYRVWVAIDSDPPVIVTTATYTWTGKTWKPA